MINNKIKKNSTTEIKEKIKKSKFDVLTYENDFLVKNLKKAGQSPRFTTIIFFQAISLIYTTRLDILNQFIKYKFSIKNKKNSAPTITIKKKYPLYYINLNMRSEQKYKR